MNTSQIPSAGKRLYNTLRFRLNWKQFTREQEAERVVKGLSRKVIIVKSPDPKIFEQAIFIVRDDYLSTQGVGQKELMRQARAAANGYVNSTSGWHRFRKLPVIACTGAACGLIVLTWLTVRFLGL